MPAAGTPCVWRDSPVLTVTCLPQLLAFAVLRSQLARGDYDQPDRLLGIPVDEFGVVDSITGDFTDALRQLVGERPLATDTWQADRRAFPSADSLQSAEAIGYVARFQASHDFSDPWECARAAEYCLESARWALHFLCAGPSPYDLIAEGIGQGDFHSYFLFTLELDALDLADAAERFRTVATLAWAKQAPPDWQNGMNAALLLIADGLAAEALEVLEKLDPEYYYYDEIPAKLPDLPDQNEPASGSGDYSNAADEAWDDADATQAARTLWLGTAKASAHRALGDFSRALEAIPKEFSGTLPEHYSFREVYREWELTLAYLEGARDGQAQYGQLLDRARLGELLQSQKRMEESQRRMERLALEDRGRSVRIERGIEDSRLDTLGVGEVVKETRGLMLDLPEAVSQMIHNGWLANEQFHKHLESLRRGWAQSAQLIEHQTRLSALTDALGERAWSLVEPDSREELRAYLDIKETWGRQYLPQAALGLVRAFEREFRRSLERALRQGLGEMDNTSWGQLLIAAQDLPGEHRLRSVGARVDELGLKALRDQVMHPSSASFTSDKFRRLEQALLHDGWDKKGLLRHVVTFRPTDPEKE